MQVLYKPLCAVYFKHNYYENNDYNFFNVIVPEETKHQLIKFGLAIKKFLSGFEIYYDSQFAGKERSIDEIKKMPVTLKFLIENNNSYLFNYTNGFDDYPMKDAALYFTNNTATINNNKLHDNEFADINNIKLTDNSLIPGTIRKPFGVIEIYLQQIEKPTYFIQFNAKKIYWRYAVATQHLREIENPAIINKSDKTVFTGPIPFILPDKRSALLFTSTQPLNINEQPNKNLQLVENYNPESGRYKVVLQMLPNPNIKHISVIDATANLAEKMKYAEVII